MCVTTPNANARAFGIHRPPALWTDAVLDRSAPRNEPRPRSRGRIRVTVRIGLLGAGRIGRVHAGAVAATAGARLVAVADAMPDAANGLSDEHGAETRDSDAIIGADDIDAVLICTPTDLHAEQIEAAARAGLAVFCEKPIALDVERTRRCLQVVEECGARLMIGFNRRFDPHYRAVKAAIEDGRVGEVEQVVITSRDPAPPPADYIRRSGGLFKDMTIHDLDEARWMLGEEPEWVFATGSVLTDPAIGEAGDVDTATVVLDCASGRTATILNSRRATYGYDQRLEVHGSENLAWANNPLPLGMELWGPDGALRAPLHDFFMTRYKDAYAAEIAAFVRGIEEGTPPSPTGADGLAALVLAEAAGRSMREGRRVMVSEVME